MKYLKALVSCAMILSYICFSFVMGLFYSDEKERRRFYIRHVHNYSKAILRVLDMELIVENRERLQEGKNYLLISNHMSYLDALYITAIRPACLITSIEMRDLPVLGTITKLSGCIYTERRNKENQRGELSEIAQALKEGFDVGIFPEATSTNGSSVLPFKRALLTAAIQAERNLLPLVIQYELIDGEKVTAKTRDLLCWYGDMSFAPHFLALQGHNRIRIRVKILEEIPVTAESSRDTLVEQAYEKIKNAYEPIA